MHECCKWQWRVIPSWKPDGEGDMWMWWPGEWHKETACPCRDRCPASRSRVLSSGVEICSLDGPGEWKWVRRKDGEEWRYWHGQAFTMPGLPCFPSTELPAEVELSFCPVPEPWKEPGHGRWQFWVDHKEKTCDVWMWWPGRPHRERDCSCSCPAWIPSPSGLHVRKEGRHLWAMWHDGSKWVRSKAGDGDGETVESFHDIEPPRGCIVISADHPFPGPNLLPPREWKVNKRRRYW